MSSNLHDSSNPMLARLDTLERNPRLRIRSRRMKEMLNYEYKCLTALLVEASCAA
jgi:hypothetical protein